MGYVSCLLWRSDACLLTSATTRKEAAYNPISSESQIMQAVQAAVDRIIEAARAANTAHATPATAKPEHKPSGKYRF